MSLRDRIRRNLAVVADREQDNFAIERGIVQEASKKRRDDAFLKQHPDILAEEVAREAMKKVLLEKQTKKAAKEVQDSEDKEWASYFARNPSVLTELPELPRDAKNKITEEALTKYLEEFPEEAHRMIREESERLLSRKQITKLDKERARSAIIKDIEEFAGMLGVPPAKVKGVKMDKLQTIRNDLEARVRASNLSLSAAKTPAAATPSPGKGASQSSAAPSSASQTPSKGTIQAYFTPTGKLKR